VTVFWVALGIVLLAFVLSFFLKAAPLRQKSAIDEANDDRLSAELAAQEAAAASGALVAPTTGSVPVVADEGRPRSS
jgi:hypothetical protein